MTEIETLRPVDVKRAKFEETSRVAQESSRKRLQNDRDKTELRIPMKPDKNSDL